VASQESSAHDAFKQAVIQAAEGSTVLTLKEITPVRLIKNPFFAQVETAYAQGAKLEELKALLGRGRAKKGMFEGDLDEGELEIGQVSAQFATILPAATIVKDMINEYQSTLEKLCKSGGN
jgi:enoyl-[acyl-carrier protein] reductase II